MKYYAVAEMDITEYRPFREARMAGAKNEFLVVAGNDVSRRARVE